MYWNVSQLLLTINSKYCNIRLSNPHSILRDTLVLSFVTSSGILYRKVATVYDLYSRKYNINNEQKVPQNLYI